MRLSPASDLKTQDKASFRTSGAFWRGPGAALDGSRNCPKRPQHGGAEASVSTEKSVAGFIKYKIIENPRRQIENNRPSLLLSVLPALDYRVSIIEFTMAHNANLKIVFGAMTFGKPSRLQISLSIYDVFKLTGS